MKKIRIGVLGCARIARRSVIPAMQQVEALQLVAVASRTKDKAQEFATQFGCEALEGYQSLLDRADIDAIYMPLPTGLHQEWVLRALEAGKHLLVEKSLASDYASVLEMVAMARKRSLLLMENFMFLYHGQHQYIRSLLQNGEIGALRCFRSSFGFPPLEPGNFRYDKALGGGALLDAAAYTVRASQLFLPGPLQVRASTLHVNEQGVDLYGSAFLVNPDGLSAEVAFGFDNFYQCNYELWGSKGKITAERAFTPGPDFSPTILLEQPGRCERIQLPAENHFTALLQEFCRCVQHQDGASKYSEVLEQSRLLDEIKNQNP